MNPSRNASVIGKRNQIQFIRANAVVGIKDDITENAWKPTTCGKEIRSFYETLLAEPSTSTVSDATVKLEEIKGSNGHPRKFAKLSNKISKRQDSATKNFEQLFKDAADGNMQGVMDYYCGKGILGTTCN